MENEAVFCVYPWLHRKKEIGNFGMTLLQGGPQPVVTGL